MGTITNVDGSERGVFGVPMLIDACEKQVFESVRLLLEYNADPSITYSGDAPLHILIKLYSSNPTDTCKKIIELLIANNRCNLVQLNEQKAPPFALCDSSLFPHFEESVRNRCQQDMEFVGTSVEEFKRGLFYAISHNPDYIDFMGTFYESFCSSSCIEELAGCHSYKSVIKEESLPGLSHLLRKKVKGLNMVNHHGQSPLHYAVSCGSIKMVTALCNCPDININVFKYSSPLHQAALSGKSEILKKLIEKGADINMKTVFTEQSESTKFNDFKEETALHLAVRAQKLECVEVMLEHAPHLTTSTNHWGNIPLHVAVLKGNLNSVLLLLQHSPKKQVNVSQC